MSIPKTVLKVEQEDAKAWVMGTSWDRHEILLYTDSEQENVKFSKRKCGAIT